MTDGLKELIKNVNECLEVCTTNVEYNTIADYISVDRGEDDEYFFQGQSCSDLIEEYENDCLYEYFSLEDYLKYVSQSW